MKFTEVIRKMIDMDVDNGTENVVRSDIFVGFRTVRQGGIIEMGVSENIVVEMAMGKSKYTPVLLLVDVKVFEEINNKP